VYVLEPPPGRGKIRFEKWPHIMEMVQAIIDRRLIVILKARQLGFSWLVAAYAVWLLLFHDGAVVLMLSKGQVEAKTLLKKARFVYRALPDSWQLPLETDSTTELSLVGMASKILALPSTEEAGRGETSTVVIQDEAESHEYLEANFTAVKPTIDGGGQMIIGSTAKKKRLISLFKELWRGSPDNGWHSIFMPWHARPGRDQKWYEETRRNIPDIPEAMELTPDLYMEQEYPNTAEEALAPARSIAAFNHDRLKAMEEDVRKPIRVIDGVGNIYQDWRVGNRYMAGSDTSHGVGGDFSCTAIIDSQTGYVVADILDNKLGPEEFAWHSMKLLEVYKNPIWAIEDNDWGITSIKAAERERYPRLYKRKTGRHNTKVGWHTDNRSRWVMWGDLIEAVESSLIVVASRVGLNQFYTVYKDPQNEGRIEAQMGAHDDYPTAVAIAWQMRKHAYGSAGKIIQMPKLW